MTLKEGQAKSIIAGMLIRDNWVVNSYQFSRWLPVGRVIPTVQELVRWQIDEICLVDISESRTSKGPNLSLINSVIESSCGTPITYGGGVRSVEDARAAISAGSERVILGKAAFDRLDLVSEVGNLIGEQATILSVPFISNAGEDYWLEPRSRAVGSLSSLVDFSSAWSGELLLQDVSQDGSTSSFRRFASIIQRFASASLSLFGGIHQPSVVAELLNTTPVRAVVVGNQMHAKELFSPRLKGQIDASIRPYGSGVPR